MSNTSNTVTVKILDKEYRVACPPDEVDSLTASARFLGGRMAEIRTSGKVVGLDRIAVMAALNITHEFLNQSSVSSEEKSVVSQGLNRLNERVSQALEQHKPAL